MPVALAALLALLHAQHCAASPGEKISAVARGKKAPFEDAEPSQWRCRTWWLAPRGWSGARRGHRGKESPLLASLGLEDALSSYQAPFGRRNAQAWGCLLWGCPYSRVLRKQAAFWSWGHALRKPGSAVRGLQLPKLRLAELWSLTPQSRLLQQHGQRVRFGCCKAWVDYKIISC